MKIRVSRTVPTKQSISGLVVEYIVAIDVTRVRFPADASLASPCRRELADLRDLLSTRVGVLVLTSFAWAGDVHLSHVTLAACRLQDVPHQVTRVSKDAF